ncbi:hypothetical protein RRG08_028557 [Elysia crispata]|uniref:Uncharacterized protein n=1 Tax=Elysia crispata TaxID=231223 RepID=A0AAE1CUR9_9GAST|nr:hypothetical protein RRG08_028557 [Elysia crispata]
MSWSGSGLSTGTSRGRFRQFSRQLSFFEDSEEYYNSDDSEEDFDRETPIQCLSLINNVEYAYRKDPICPIISTVKEEERYEVCTTSEFLLWLSFLKLNLLEL